MIEQHAVAVGFFDGLHRGHHAVIQAAVSSGLPTTICTFPLRDAPPGHLSPWLLLPEQRASILRDWGVTGIAEWGYRQIGSLSPEAYVDRLRDELGATVLSCGYNYRFGEHARGDVEVLRRLCDQRGIELRVARPIAVDGQAVSSSRIRTLLAEGHPMQAARCLGRPFSFSLPVVTGRQLGRQLHFPTINQALPPELMQPLFGVYVSGVMLDGALHKGVTNVGVKPTVGSDCVLAETYIFDCDEDLYGQTLEVALYDYIRPERKFPNLDALQDAIHQDTEYARAFSFQSLGRPSPALPR